MKRREAKALGVLDQHHGGVRDVDTDFDHRGRDQDVELARFELLHHAFFLFARQTAVQQAHAELGKNVVRELFIHPLSGAQLQLVGLLDQGVDHVGLLAALDLGADELEGARAVLLAQEPRLDRRAVRRKLVNHRQFQIAVHRERERTRNRRGGHDENIGRVALREKLLALFHTEAMLLVDDCQPERFEFAFFFEQRVSPDHHLDVAVAQTGLERASLGCRRRPGRLCEHDRVVK